MKLRILIMLACAAPWSAARGTIVERMSVETLADLSAAAFVGEVRAVRSRWEGAPSRIQTEVTFQVLEVLKGMSGEDSVTVTVPGGRVGDVAMRIVGAPEFAIGQRWVLMLQASYRTHPVVGIWQGAIRVVEASDGTHRVLSAGGGPVTGLSDSGYIETAERAAPATALPAAQHGARVVSFRDTADAAMSLEAFLAGIRPILAASRSHSDGTVFARRVPTVYQPVGFKRAQAPAAVEGDANGPHEEVSR